MVGCDKVIAFPPLAGCDVIAVEHSDHPAIPRIPETPVDRTADRRGILSVTLGSVKRVLAVAVLALTVGLAIDYGRTDAHSGVAVALAVAMVVLLLDHLARMGSR